jgi:hypothetical protein
VEVTNEDAAVLITTVQVSTASPYWISPAQKPKINLSNVAYFSVSDNRHLFPDEPPGTHHEFTTKTPRKNTRFSRTPIKNAAKPKETGSTGASDFFPKPS